VLKILVSMAGATALAAFLAVASLLVVPGGIVASVRSSPPIERITENKADSSGRVEIWSVGLFACRTECAWGAGIGNFPDTFNNLYPFAGLGRDVGQQRPAHNVYLSVVVETGIVGLTLFLLALAAEWRSLSSPAQVLLAPALRPALLGLLLASVFLSAVWFKYFWLVFVLVRVVEGAAENEPDAPIAERFPEPIRRTGLVGVLPSRDGFS
jgi:O-antigen ligase